MTDLARQYLKTLNLKETNRTTDLVFLSLLYKESKKFVSNTSKLKELLFSDEILDEEFMNVLVVLDMEEYFANRVPETLYKAAEKELNGQDLYKLMWDFIHKNIENQID